VRSALLSCGFLPRELPPPFNSASLRAFGAGPLPAAISNDLSQTTPVSHNLPRGGLMRRPLSIPDPIRYLRLVVELEINWLQIQGHFYQAGFALTRPRRDHLGHRAFTFTRGFEALPDCRAQLRAGARYILQADINQFYPTLYTHVIPWAMHGKAIAKANRKNTLFGNVIDARVRDGQDGQTMGIGLPHE
jgi:hypothetical protein